MTKITDKVQVTVEYGMYPALFRDILPKRDFYEHTIDYLLSSKDHLSSVAIL